MPVRASCRRRNTDITGTTDPAESTAAPSGTEKETQAPATTEAPVPETTQPETEPVDEGPDDVPIQIDPAGDVIDKYTKDETDHSAQPLSATKYVRLHYRRNDDTSNDRSCYVPWNIWAWDMTNGGNGAAYEFTGYDDYGVYVDLDLAVISGGNPAASANSALDARSAPVISMDTLFIKVMI